MAFFKKVYEKLLGEEADEEVENKEVNEAVEVTAQESAEKEEMAEDKNLRDFSAGSRSLELKIAKLSAFDGGVMEIADHLIAGRPVVLNLESAKGDAVKRIIDFFSGVAYTVRGQLKNISGNIYIVTPSTVDVSSDALLFTSGGKSPALDHQDKVPAPGAAPSPSGSPYEGF